MFCECDIYHRGNTQCNVKCRIIVLTKPQVRIRLQLLYKNRPGPAADKGRARNVKSVWPPSVANVFKMVLMCQQGVLFNQICPMEAMFNTHTFSKHNLIEGTPNSKYFWGGRMG